MASLKQIEQKNKSLGAVSFGTGKSRVLLVPWGPAQGFYALDPQGFVRKNQLALRWVRVAASPKDRFWTRQELQCAAAVRKSGKSPETARAVASSRLRSILDHIPAPVLSTSRKQKNHRMRSSVIIAANLLMAEAGQEHLREAKTALKSAYLPLAGERDALIILAAMRAGRKKALRHFSLPFAEFARKIWPKATEEAHAALRRWFRPELGEGGPAVFGTASVQRFLARPGKGDGGSGGLAATYAPSGAEDVYYLMSVWGAAPRKRSFVNGILSDGGRIFSFVDADLSKWPKFLREWLSDCIDQEPEEDLASSLPRVINDISIELGRVAQAAQVRRAAAIAAKRKAAGE